MRRHAVAIALHLLLSGLAAVAHAATPAAPAQGRHCKAMLPEGWSIIAENPAGTAFGADAARHDGSAVASYFIVGVPAAMRTDPTYGRWYQTPAHAAYAMLSRYGSQPVQCGAPGNPAPALTLMQCRTPQYVGLALYQVFPLQDGGYVLVMRTAGSVPARWPADAGIASAVARSFRCNVPFTPRQVDWTSPAPGSGGRGAAKDSGYSRWLGMEHYHDERTGENFWVSPSSDWVENGPQGAGYYVRRGNDLRKLSPGRSD